MKPETRSLLYVAIAGAVGGLTSWLLQWLAGLAPFQRPAFEGILALIVVGGVAAVFGVYLLANSDLKQMNHTLAFALLCGVFWQPVFEAARLYIQHSTTQYDAAQQQTKTGDLASALPNADPATVKNKMENTTNTTTELLSKLPNVQDSDLRSKVVEQSNQAVEVVSKAADKAPDATVANLQKIGETAAQNGQPEVANHVLMKLDALKAQNPTIAPQADQARAGIVKSEEKRLGPLGSAIRSQK
jgi:hypothetical protein